MVCFAIYSANNALTRAYQPLLAKLGLTYPQYLVMLVLWEQEHQTVKAIGDRLNLDSGTLTPLLKRLEAAALVTRRRDIQDERQVRIGLTERGRELRHAAEIIPPAVACAMGRPLEQLLALRQDLIGVRDSLLESAREQKTE